MRKINLLCMLILCYLLVGCASHKQTYYWGDYSHSLYNYKKLSNEENIQKHKLVLQEIINESNARGLRVPPGVYCEYGYILMKEGNNKEALINFQLEEQTYPESKVFIQKLKSKVQEDGV